MEDKEGCQQKLKEKVDHLSVTVSRGWVLCFLFVQSKGKMGMYQGVAAYLFTKYGYGVGWRALVTCKMNESWTALGIISCFKNAASKH